MTVFMWILVFLAAFLVMEFMAWFTHKYIMHGFLWILHKDHHKKNNASWFERNDVFFLFYAAISIVFICLWKYQGLWVGLPVGIGIFVYGSAYFLVHDIFIHQRIKRFKNAEHWYAKGIRRAHKVHHKHLGKENGECFGMLVVPFKYFRKN